MAFHETTLEQPAEQYETLAHGDTRIDSAMESLGSLQAAFLVHTEGPSLVNDFIEAMLPHYTSMKRY